MPQGPSLDTGQMKGVGNEEVAEGGSESLCSSRLSTPSLFAPVRDFGVRELPGASLSAHPTPPTAGPAPSGGSDFQRLLPPLGLDADLSVQQRPASCPVSLKVILFAGVRGPFRLSKAGPSGPSIRESDCPAGRGRNGAEARRPRRAHLSELPPALGAAGATPFHAARKAM